MDQVLEYAVGLSANKEVMDWLKTSGKKALVKNRASVSDLEHVVDYLVSGSAPSRLRRMSIEQAKALTDKWSSANQKKGRGLIDTDLDIECVHDFLDGTKIVRLKTKKALQREGFLMNHCVGSYDEASDNCYIYSYRDKDNLPHATFELRKDSDEIVQIKGKGNGEIHPKYIHPILAFLKTVGMDIRPYDMRNLGYYEISKDIQEYINRYEALQGKTTVINGTLYAHM